MPASQTTPTKRQIAALDAVDTAREALREAEAAALAARKAWIESMFKASFVGNSHAVVSRHGGIIEDRYRVLRKENGYAERLAAREAQLAARRGASQEQHAA